MAKKLPEIEQTQSYVNEELRATVSFLTSARSVLIGERDKTLAQLKEQDGVIVNLRNTLVSTARELGNIRNELRNRIENEREDNFSRLDKAMDEVDAVSVRNVVITVLSVPYLIAVVSFLCHHLSVSLH